MLTSLPIDYFRLEQLVELNVAQCALISLPGNTDGNNDENQGICTEYRTVKHCTMHDFVYIELGYRIPSNKVTPSFRVLNTLIWGQLH